MEIDYYVERILKDRLAEARAVAERGRLIRRSPGPGPARLAVGRALRRLSHWLLGADAHVPGDFSPPPRPSGSR